MNGYAVYRSLEKSTGYKRIIELGDDNRAVEDFDYVVRMEPSNFMAIYNRALLLDRIGDLRGAIRDYTTVINQFPNFWTGLEQRAWCYRRLGMTSKAELDEFRVFKAQMDKHVGIQKRWSKAKLRDVRKRSEINLDKFNQIVVEDEPEVDHEYKSIYRGRVQNREVDIDMMPMYMLPYRYFYYCYPAPSASALYPIIIHARTLD